MKNGYPDDLTESFADPAINWAMGCLGSADYRGLCLAFVEDALERSNGIEIFGGSSAKESADLYEAHQHTGIPPKGSFVFYDCLGSIRGEEKNWGHVGLSVVEGKIVHAWDRVRVDDYLEVQNLTPAAGWDKPKYIGWAPLERVTLGFRKRIY